MEKASKEGRGRGVGRDIVLCPRVDEDDERVRTRSEK